jgi:hypothetical protein
MPVIPAQAGIQVRGEPLALAVLMQTWIPAFAGMTVIQG